MKNGTSQEEDRLILNLSEWELANLHLPPVTTVTFYSGTAPVEFLRRRVESILKTNPWLTARIVKKTTADGVVAMAYYNTEEPPPVSEQFSGYEPEEVGLSLNMEYGALVRCLLPLQTARSKPATDEDEPLFKVAVVPIEPGEDDPEPTPMQNQVTSPGFALVVSMNHTVGDGHTYYRLYGMLGTDTEVEALDPVRVPGFEEAKTRVIGENESAMFASAGIGLGIVGTYMLTRLTRREPQNLCVHAIDPVWIAQEKAKANDDAQVPFISSNDALTS